MRINQQLLLDVYPSRLVVIVRLHVNVAPSPRCSAILIILPASPIIVHIITSLAACFRVVTDPRANQTCRICVLWKLLLLTAVLVLEAIRGSLACVLMMFLHFGN